MLRPVGSRHPAHPSSAESDDVEHPNPENERSKPSSFFSAFHHGRPGTEHYKGPQEPNAGALKRTVRFKKSDDDLDSLGPGTTGIPSGNAL
jgi:hypothetical protein